MLASPLFAPCTWRLQPGAAGAPALKRAGTLLLLSLAGLCGTWLWALGQDVWRGGCAASDLIPAAVVVAVWWFALRAAWASWRRVRPVLSLTWAGEVQPHENGQPATGGWRLDGVDGEPVTVRCLLDAQSWLLCQITSVPGGRSPPQSHWCWVGAQTCTDWHRFRTLITLPAKQTTAVRGGADRSALAMASWLPRRHPSGSPLRGPSDTFMPTQPLHKWGDIAEPKGQDRS